MLKFELKKFYKKKAFHIIFFIALIWTLVLFFYSSYQERNIVDITLKKLTHIELYMEDMAAVASYRKKAFEQTKKLEEQLAIKDPEHKIDEGRFLGEEENVEIFRALVSKTGNALFQLKYDIRMGNWSKVPYAYNELYQAIDALEKGENQEHISEFERVEMIALSEYLMENNLEYKDLDISTAIGPFVKRSIDIMFWFVGIILIAILFGHSLSEEFEDGTFPTIKKLPKSNIGILLNKFLAMIIGTLFYMILILLFGGMFSLIKNGDLSSLNYPVFVKGIDFHYSPYDNYLIVSTKDYILTKTIVFFNASLILYGIMILLGSFTRSITNIIISLLLALIGSFSSKGIASFRTFLNPLYYFNLEDLKYTLLFNFRLTYTLFSIVFLLLMVFIVGKIGFYGINFSNNWGFRSTAKDSKLKNSLGSLSFFELKKQFKRGDIRLILISLTILLFSSYLFLSSETYRHIDMYKGYILNAHNGRIMRYCMPNFDFYIEKFQEIIQLDSTEDHNLGGVNYNKNSAKQALKRNLKLKEFYEEVMELNERHLEIYDKKDWQDFYDHQLFILNAYSNGPDYGTLEVFSHFIPYKLPVNDFQLEVSIREKEILKGLDAPPALNNLFLQTIYDTKEEDADPSARWWYRVWNIYHNTGLHSFHKFIESGLYLISMIIIVVLLGMGITTEFGKRKPIKFLLTQPIEIKDLFKGKLKTSIILSIAANLLVIILILAIGSINAGLGEPLYPILCYDADVVSAQEGYTGYIADKHGYEFIPIIKYILQAELLVILITIFLLILTNTLSILFNSKFKLFTSGAIIIGIGYLISINTLNNIGGFLPFTYFNIPKVLNGELSAIYNNPMLSFRTGVFVLLVSNILLFILGKFVSGNVEISCEK